jgi:hypothetical protein
MKNTIIVTVLCMALQIGHAQPALDVALKGGPNAATQAQDFRVNRYGFSAGLSGSAQWSMTNRFSLGGQLELLYTPRGSETVFEGENIGRLREHYLDLALMARPAASLGPVSFYLVLGGSLNLLMSASKDDATGAGQDVTNGLHRVDVALLGGIGAALHLSHHEPGPLHLGTVFVEVRHDIGLLDVDLDGGLKNRTSSLMLGLSFDVGGSAASDTTSTSQTAFTGRSAPR